MTILTTYLQRMSEIRRTGSAVKETSFYGTLENLFNEIGKELKPRVRCVINLQNRGGGIPDGGFFTPNQFQKQSHEILKGQLPERGCIEIKSTSESVEKTAESEQVAKYLRTYRQVLVTNYRDFLLVVLDENNQKQKLERYKLAEDEKDFWQKADNESETVKLHEARFIEFLKRVMLHAAPISKPEDVAWFLASYARDAKARIEHSDISALETIRKALEDSLGIKFEGEKGEKFFRSTLVQTLFYGVFSAWVLWHKRHAGGMRDESRGAGGMRDEGRGMNKNSQSERDFFIPHPSSLIPFNPHPSSLIPFNWRTAVWELRVPMISVLFEQIATPSNLKQLDLVEVLDWTASVLNRVVREEFFQRFSEDHAVQYFYEPFLQAFDPELRKELGVWYTPQEIVKYMVERVNQVLIDELDLPDGLADESVYVLDPACGTGAYLVEVLRRINQTLVEKGEDVTRGQKLKKAVQSRVFGFEILPAPFVVSHLQIGLLFEQFGIGLSDEKRERAGVFLTNSLTGWDEHPKTKLPFPEFEEERSRADQVKKEAKILVIIGNPPYNAFAGVSGEEEQGLVEPYKEGLIANWGIKKFNLDDLYVRFFRLAERRIAEKTHKGIVCFISNYSWTSEPSFVVMREKMLKSFDKIWVENMHGNRKISEYAPDGKTSETVFALKGFSVGIQQGVTISTLVRSENHTDGETLAKVFYRDDLNEAKADERRKHLLNTLEETDFQENYEETTPEKFNRFTLRSSVISKDYQTWIKLDDLSIVKPFAGLSEDRKKSLIGIDKQPLELRMKMYFDKNVTWEELSSLRTCLTTDVPRFDAKKARINLLEKESFNSARLLPYVMRPFDTQWCYYSPVRPLWREPRPAYWNSYEVGTESIVTRFKSAKDPEGTPLFVASSLCDYHAMPPNSSVIPFRLRVSDSKKNENQNNLFSEVKEETRANLSEFARKYLESLGFTEIDNGEIKEIPPKGGTTNVASLTEKPPEGGTTNVASLIWYHALAIGYASEYLTENADGIRQDFPRIPLPKAKDDLIQSATLGKKIAAILDTEKQVAGVTVGKIDERLRSIGVAAHAEGKQFQDDDFAVTAGWGHTGKDGVTMPAKGKYNIREAEIKSLGETTYDIFINDVAYWRNVPEKVWQFYIGGYQVIKKWLSYRESKLLGRPLSLDEITEVTNMIRRISAIILLENDLNENYRKIKKDFYKI